MDRNNIILEMTVNLVRKTRRRKRRGTSPFIKTTTISTLPVRFHCINSGLYSSTAFPGASVLDIDLSISCLTPVHTYCIILHLAVDGVLYPYFANLISILHTYLPSRKVPLQDCISMHGFCRYQGT